MQAFKWGFRCLSLLADVDNINYKLLEEENKTPNLLRYIHEICSNIYKFISESWRLLWCYHKSCQTDYDVALKKKKVFWSTWISALSKCADSLWRIKKKMTYLGFNFMFRNINMNFSVTVFFCCAAFCAVLRLRAGTTRQSADWSEPSLE